MILSPYYLSTTKKMPTASVLVLELHSRGKAPLPHTLSTNPPLNRQGTFYPWKEARHHGSLNLKHFQARYLWHPPSFIIYEHWTGWLDDQEGGCDPAGKNRKGRVWRREAWSVQVKYINSHRTFNINREIFQAQTNKHKPKPPLTKSKRTLSCLVWGVNRRQIMITILGGRKWLWNDYHNPGEGKVAYK